MSMRIGIDMSRTAETKTGLASYAESLVAGLARVDQRNRYVIHPYTWHCFVRDYHRAFCPRAANFARSRAWLPRRLVTHLWERGKVNKDWLVGEPADVFFSPFHAVPQRRMGKLVCTFHDVAFLTHPEFATEENRRFCAEQLELARCNADAFITVSQHSKRELVQYGGVPAERITVVLEAADPRYRRDEAAVLPPRLRELVGGDGRFLLYVGSVEPRKNLITLVHAYARLRQRVRALPPLVIAGGSGWKNSSMHEAIASLDLVERVRLAGFVSDAELVALYNRALAFVFPTIHEGFGLPVVEAMSCGAPVVTTRVASIPEVGGEAVLYCDDPTDPDELAAALQRVIEDEALRARLAREGQARAATFSWDRAARETLAVFEATHRATSRPRHALVIGDDERALGSGWHGLERDGDTRFRWASGRATLTLDAAPGRGLAIEAASPLPGQRLVVRAGRRVLGTFPMQAGWQTYTVAVEGGSPVVPIALEIAPSLPQHMKGEDRRDLAAMVRRVGFV